MSQAKHCFLTLFSLLLLLAFQARATGSEDVVGTWSWTMPKTNCQMTRTYRSDGSTTVVNGKKTVAGTYSIKWNKKRTGRMLISTIVSDDGGMDCDGASASTVGKRYLAYVFAEGSDMYMCLDSARTSCLGPYRKR
jgi:hypothetical protein